MTLAEDTKELLAKISRLESDKRDLEIALTTAIEHGDAIEMLIEESNQRLRREISDRLRAESRLQKLFDVLSRQKEDLELIVKTITEHSDQLDIQWLEKYCVAEEEARVDVLTQLANRRRFDEVLDEEWRRALRSREPLSLIICDVDHFKHYNDRYGHPAGDACLVKVAHALKETCRRDIDLVARYGGEEFGIILPQTDLQGALKIASGIRQRLAELSLVHEASCVSCRVTLSIGLTSRVPEQGFGRHDLLAEADQLLYRAKQQGRNQVAF